MKNFTSFKENKEIIYFCQKALAAPSIVEMDEHAILKQRSKEIDQNFVKIQSRCFRIGWWIWWLRFMFQFLSTQIMHGDIKIRICLYITMKFNLLFKDRSEWQQALWLNVIYVLIKTNLYKKILILSLSSHYVDETQTLDKKYLYYAQASNRQGRVRKRSPWLRAQLALGSMT